MKLTNKKKKVSVTVGAVALSPAKRAVLAQPVAAAQPSTPTPPAASPQPALTTKPTVPTAAQPVRTKAESPQVARIALQLVEPAAKHVYVAGSFNGWKPDSTPIAPPASGRRQGRPTPGPGRPESF